MLREMVAGFRGMTQGDDSAQFERYVRGTMRQLARQRVGMVYQPGNVWVIEKAVEDNQQSDAALKTAYMRGWVEPLENSVPKGSLGPNGELPTGELYNRIGPIWKLTEGGWAVINRTHGWTLFAILVSILSLVVSIVSLVISLKGTHAR